MPWTQLQPVTTFVRPDELRGPRLLGEVAEKSTAERNSERNCAPRRPLASTPKVTDTLFEWLIGGNIYTTELQCPPGALRTNGYRCPASLAATAVKPAAKTLFPICLTTASRSAPTTWKSAHHSAKVRLPRVTRWSRTPAT